jgi:hypothetical protein
MAFWRASPSGLHARSIALQKILLLRKNLNEKTILNKNKCDPEIY